jgi:hypothetical protein
MRVLRGAEAEVFRQALGRLADIIRALDDWDEEWEICIGALEGRILWDRDWELEEDFADAPPGQACRMKDLLAISDDYFRAIPPDAKDEDADEIVKRLANVLH